MATVNLGAIKFNWKGAYNNSTAYVADDVVSSGGNSYVCILASTGNAVSNGTYWSLMAQAGTDGTDGTTVGLGTAGQVLKTNSGASAIEWGNESGGAWNFISTAVASNSSEVTVTGMNDTYSAYAIIISQLIPATDGQNPLLRLGDSNGLDTAVGDYAYSDINNRSNSTGVGGSGNTNGSSILINCQDGVGNNTGEGFSAMMHILQPSSGAMSTMISWHAQVTHANAGTVNVIGAGRRTSVISHDRIAMLMSSGNITSGRITLYGIAHS